MMSVNLRKYKMFTDPTHRYTYRIECITTSPIDIFDVTEPDNEVLIDINYLIHNVEVIDVFRKHRGY